MTVSPDQADKSSNAIPWWVKSSILLSVTGVVCYKLIITPFNLQFDFPSFLSLLLAFFSVGLAALFYFKATDTSNAFYDNTYKFSQEIAGLLVKIESGFGEKLTHLDQAYAGMRDRFDQLPGRFQIKDAKNELKQEEQELAKILSDKEELINELVNKAHLREEEKEKFLSELRAKEDALHEAQQEIHFLKSRLRRAEIPRRKTSVSEEIAPGMVQFIKSNVIRRMGGPQWLITSSPGNISKKFRRMSDELPPDFLEDLRDHGLLAESGELPPEGVELFVTLAKEME